MTRAITDRVDIFKLLSGYVAMFPTNTLSPKGLDMYSDRLTTYPLTKIELAMEELVRSSRYFPTLADIISTIRSNYREPVYGSPEWQERETRKAERHELDMQILARFDKARDEYLAKFTKRGNDNG